HYTDETETVAKSLTELKEGDKLDFICDYYTRDLQYQDSYYLGEQMTVSSEMVISNVSLGENEARITYLFTDIYNQEYWSEAIIVR
ncbi:MAG: peptidase C11, partial [Oscillospiraceae bacterium]|nr:peptidase C11 [Oscillospiraceae bacterium]